MNIKELDKNKNYVLSVSQAEFEEIHEHHKYVDKIKKLNDSVKELFIIAEPATLTEAKQIRYKLLHENAKPLSRGHDDDSGFDLTTAWIEPFIVDNGDGSDVSGYKLHMGIAVAPPDGYYFDMRPRSSFSKTGYVLGNSVGTIDKGYRGELMAIVHPTRRGLPELKAGGRHFQLILQRYENDGVILQEVHGFEETERGAGGFGSTGK